MFSIKTFMTKVEAVNSHFERHKTSSLHNLIALMNKNEPRIKVLDAIGKLPKNKATKYKTALDYVDDEYDKPAVVVPVWTKPVVSQPTFIGLPPPPLPTIVTPPPSNKTFEQIAGQLGMTYNRFEQANSKYLDANPDGFCAAASMAFCKTKRDDPDREFNYFSNKPRSTEADKKRRDIITDLYADEGVMPQLAKIKGTLETKYKMTFYGQTEKQNASIKNIYFDTYNKGQGQFILFMCIFKSGIDTDNHFMAISLGSKVCSFFDPNEGEITGPIGKYWEMLWTIFDQGDLKCYMPDNITSTQHYYKHP